jgi:cytochrome c
MSEEHHKSTGSGMFWFQVVCSLSLAAILVISASWAANIVMPPPPNQDNAYEIDYPERELDVARSHNVNLAAVQRSWPFGMDSKREKELLAHNRSLLKSNPSALTRVAYVDTTEAMRSTPKAAAIVVPLPNLLATADITRGATVAKKCLSCHTFGNGGKDSTGPNLWDVVGAERARNADFKYSAAMAEFGGSWTLESLNDYLRKPGKYIKNTRMAFAGIRSDADRASLIAYMRSQSDNPVALPEVVNLDEAPEDNGDEIIGTEGDG